MEEEDTCNVQQDGQMCLTEKFNIEISSSARLKVIGCECRIGAIWNSVLKSPPSTSATSRTVGF